MLFETFQQKDLRRMWLKSLRTICRFAPHLGPSLALRMTQRITSAASCNHLQHIVIMKRSNALRVPFAGGKEEVFLQAVLAGVEVVIGAFELQQVGMGASLYVHLHVRPPQDTLAVHVRPQNRVEPCRECLLAGR